MIRGAIAVTLALGACGGPQKPAEPPPFDPRPLAARIQADLEELAAVAHRHRAACPTLAAELRALFPRMQATVDEAHHVEQNTEHARLLTTELHRYDEANRGLGDAIVADLTACKDDPDVREAMRTMPTL